MGTSRKVSGSSGILYNINELGRIQDSVKGGSSGVS